MAIDERFIRKNEVIFVELKGTVTLDEESMSKLKDQIRKEVVEDIRKNGSYSFEVERYLKACNFEHYLMMIEETIDTIISKTSKNDIQFASGWEKWHKLLAIKSILEI